MQTNENIKDRVVAYWGKRSDSFLAQRKAELVSEKAERWKKEILPYLPEDKKAPILDIGTGCGFFSILLAHEGYENVTGIDLTPEMIEKAKLLAEDLENPPTFLVMDAEKPEFPSDSIAAIVTRNLTWTLPHVSEAYQEWYRILKKDGVLLNFDADYAEEVGKKEEELPANHAHRLVGSEMRSENDFITTSMPISHYRRPTIDVQLLKNAGFGQIHLDLDLSERMYREIDEFYNPAKVFTIRAWK